ncbi:ATP-dependent helicase [Frankia sp. Cj3]|uniref:ATP-dependent helicase n=1 Tax=Frankia sp. Cj3 TaxID=2880976 RepID=UPI001EF6AF72|nr:ATP-dependent helicase [Frankia sp. Cj3]
MSALRQSIEELKFNPRQWEAFSAPGHCVVLAPPGSGKTKLLTTRLANDLQAKIPLPHGAACITLTNAAADELRRRVDALGVEDRSTLFIGTVHSFTLNRIVVPFASVIGRRDMAGLSIASEAQRKQAFDEAIDEVFRAGSDHRYVRSTIEFNRQRLATDEDWSHQSTDVREVARRYTNKLRTWGLYDFSDVIALAVEIVEQHPAIRRVLTAEYPHLYVDEYQDLAPGLDRLVRSLCFDYCANSKLFAVGDPDQAVFAFTGTRPELLAELADEAGSRSDLNVVHLDHNYRCGAEIVRYANLMRRGGTAMTGDRTGGSVSAQRCPTGYADQCRQVVAHISEAITRGFTLHEIAVLCPTNDQCIEMADALRAAGMPAFVRSSHYRLGLATSFVEGCAAWATLGRECSGHRLKDLLARWRSLLGPRWSQREAVELTRRLLEYGATPDERANALLEDLLKIGLEKALAMPSLRSEAAEVGRMGAALTTGQLSNLSVGGLGNFARKRDRVEVTTLTASKGLEFNVVLITGMDEESVPHYLSLVDPEKIAEDRRKFYVSLTRARDEVRIFYSGFVVTKRGRRKNTGSSRFLSEIGLV